MNIRGLVLVLVLGVPAVGLLVFGPRGQHHVPPGRIVLRYWEKWTGVEGVAVKRLVDRFNQTTGAEKGIWVEYTPVSNVEQRTLIATAGGDPPDVAGLYDFIVPQFAAQSALLPLDDLAREFSIDASAFKPAWWQIGIYDNVLYAFPSSPYTIALYYNKRLFRDAGLDPEKPPRTIAEFNECARRLTKRSADGKRIEQLGFTLSTSMLGWWPWIWPCFFDANLWDGKSFRIETPEGIAAMQWVVRNRREMADAGFDPTKTGGAGALSAILAFESAAGEIESAQNPFLSQRVAMIFQGPWLANWALKYAPDLDFGIAPFPSISADRQNNFASADVFVIPRSSRHPREAMVFLAFMLRQDVMEEMCREHGKVSPFLNPGADFFARHPNPHIRVFNDMADSPHAFGYPKMPMWAQAVDTMKQLLDVAMRAESPDSKALTAAIHETQQKMDRAVDASRKDLRQGFSHK